MFALRINNGERVWYTAPEPCGNRPRCSPAQSAAVTAIPGVAFSGCEGTATCGGYFVSGREKSFGIRHRRQAFETVNGVGPGHGGALDGPGPAIGGGCFS